MMLILSLAILSAIQSCGIYSFDGAYTAGAETIRIDFFDNKAPIVVPELSQVFTQALRDKFRNESPLIVSTKKGDWELSGYISNYNTTFLALQDDAPAKTRLQITVNVKFVNNLDPDKSFERKFSQFEDFDANVELGTIETELIELISEKIIIDIYNATVNNW